MHGFSPLYSPYLLPLLGIFLPLLVLVLLWTVAIKGYALWHAARNSQRNWFVALLIINSVGILEIIYLVWFRPRATPAHPSSAQGK